MTGFAEIVVVAFTTQLAALPGEKVQFIIAGLSTKYHPAVVVGAAGTAFGLWTVLEIWVGSALQAVLPGAYLTAITGGLFLVFAVWLFRSIPTGDSTVPETDGGVAEALSVPTAYFGIELPRFASGFLPIFVMMAAGEFGDKTQLVTIGLAATYGASPAIWIGEMLAIIPVSIANAVFFHRFSPRIDRRLAHVAGGTLFAFFALDSALTLAFDVSIWEQIVAAVSSAIVSVL
ncbi:MAG: TMEM165/GDT1 family protein [Halanaeroarchaeum sp.]